VVETAYLADRPAVDLLEQREWLLTAVGVRLKQFQPLPFR
jgi:hypothetical protein